MATRKRAVGPQGRVAKGKAPAPAKGPVYPPRDRLGLRLSPALYERLVTHCKALMSPTSLWVSTQVEQALAGPISAGRAAKFDDGPSDGRKMLTVRMLPSLLRNVEEVAATLSAGAPEAIRLARLPSAPVSANRLVAFIVKTALDKKSKRRTKPTVADE